MSLFLTSGFWILTPGFLHPSHADTDLADSWAVISKGIGGVFTDSGGNWAEYAMTDTDAQGRQYIDLWLVPGAKVDFKAILRPNGTKIYESDFKTSSGRRTLTVPTLSTTILMNWSDTPGAPTNLKAYTDSGKATLTWTAPSGDSGEDVRTGGGYYIYYDTGPVFDTWLKFRNDTVYSTAYTCTNLTNDSIYYFSVRVFDAYLDTVFSVGTFSDSVTVSPGNPANVRFRIFVGQMSDSEVYIGFDSGAGWTERPMMKEGSTDWWNETVPLNRGFDFAYKFVIKDTAGTKTFEFPGSGGRGHMFTYPDKSGVSSVSVKGSWDWGVSNTMRKDADGYWRKDVNIPNGGVFEYGFAINGGVSWDTDPENHVTKNGNSVIGVDATREAGAMRRLIVPETTVTVTITGNWEDTPYAPADFKAMSNTNNTILLTWTKAGQIEDLDSYRIEYTELPSDSTSWLALAVLDADITSYTHANIIPSDTYYYRIYTVDFAGDTSGWKNYASANATLRKEILFLIDNSPKKSAGERLYVQRSRFNVQR